MTRTAWHLAALSEAKVWDVEACTQERRDAGGIRPELRIAQFNLKAFGTRFLISPPEFDSADPDQKVCRRGGEVILRQGGFLLWTTKEVVGTPLKNADLICFVDGKSTRARAGIVVHLTAPTVHSTWEGNVILEIANLGPFDIASAKTT